MLTPWNSTYEQRAAANFPNHWLTMPQPYSPPTKYGTISPDVEKAIEEANDHWGTNRIFLHKKVVAFVPL